MPSDSKQFQPKPVRDPADRRIDEAVEGTFPASDPATTGAIQGARAVAPEEIMRSAQEKPAAPADAVTLQHRFRDAAAAKLALEALVREGPLDRRCAELVQEGEAASLRVAVARADAERLGELLRRQGGEEGGEAG